MSDMYESREFPNRRPNISADAEGNDGSDNLLDPAEA